jgi:hypothetical protein
MKKEDLEKNDVVEFTTRWGDHCIGVASSFDERCVYIYYYVKDDAVSLGSLDRDWPVMQISFEGVERVCATLTADHKSLLAELSEFKHDVEGLFKIYQLQHGQEDLEHFVTALYKGCLLRMILDYRIWRADTLDEKRD